MTEYITKEQAVDVVNTAFGHIYDSDSETVSLVDLENEIIMTIEQHTEPADVALVVHAYWRGIEGDGYDPEGNIVWDTFECSNCGEEHHADGEPEWDYCPCCGARMDGKEND